MAYADDLMCFIRSAEEWATLKEILDTYGRASNARLNLRKTVAFPLYNNLGILSESLQRERVQFHSKRAEEALVYLGFPIAVTKSQRIKFFDNIHLKIKKHIAILGGRQLSVMGRGICELPFTISTLACHSGTPTNQGLVSTSAGDRQEVCGTLLPSTILESSVSTAFPRRVRSGGHSRTEPRFPASSCAKDLL
jgi:hypothetical protein